MKLFLQTLAGTKLALQCIEFDTYRVAIGLNCVEFDTRFNVNKYITICMMYDGTEQILLSSVASVTLSILYELYDRMIEYIILTCSHL